MFGPDKTIRVVLSKNVEKEFEKLNKIVGEEKKEGITNSDNQRLLKSINRALDLIKQNPEAGIQIRKRLIPRKYIKEFEINNLWKFNLVNYWRMLYTLKTDKIEIISFVLEIIDHKKYSKLFGYKKK